MSRKTDSAGETMVGDGVLLLGVDAVINVLLGVLLVVFPRPVVEALGIPVAASGFYPGILGAVLIGIGIALWIARSGGPGGLGLGGAIAINLCGGIALAGWLLFGNLAIPVRGHVVLWLLVLLLIGLSSVELAARRESGRRSGIS